MPEHYTERMNIVRSLLSCRAHVAFAFACALAAVPSHAQNREESLTLGVVTFLSGPAAAASGIPGRNGAELVINAINEGRLPAPYQTMGLGGAKIEPIYLDEAGGNAKAVTETRNLVERRGAKIIAGFISSGACQAVAPVVEELKVLTVFATCGTPRIFEEASRRYVFRSMGHTTPDGVAAARYLAQRPDKVIKFTGINQNYAFGTDAWSDFSAATTALVPGAAASDKPQWPKFLAGQYGTEISALQLDESNLVYSSFWGGDLEAFVLQAGARGLFQQKLTMLSFGADAYDKLGNRMPDGIIVGARGPYGLLVRDRNTALNRWFVEQYNAKYGEYPNSAAYHYAQSVLAVKAAYDKAQRKAGRAPSVDEAVDAMIGMEFESFSTTVRFAIGAGHQAVTENGYAVTKFDTANNRPGLTDIKFFPASCLFPPDGVAAEQWLKTGLRDSKC
jgi:branched-chain amino acid transport system substrate-binding protein